MNNAINELFYEKIEERRSLLCRKNFECDGIRLMNESTKIMLHWKTARNKTFKENDTRIL